MRLKSLELQGFKTFPDRTTLSFDNGVTAVVGPNGSGKSNISDAIRWVLGEQSARTLRCARMEGLIFNGTPHRKARALPRLRSPSTTETEGLLSTATRCRLPVVTTDPARANISSIRRPCVCAISPSFFLIPVLAATAIR